MLKDARIAVIGAGIGGLAVATALARRGARVVVHEQASRISEVGAGLQISPNGAAVLAALGLRGRLLAEGVQSQAVELRDYRRGGRVLRLNITQFHKKHPFIIIHQTHLIKILKNTTQTTSVQIILKQHI